MQKKWNGKQFLAFKRRAIVCQVLAVCKQPLTELVLHTFVLCVTFLAANGLFSCLQLVCLIICFIHNCLSSAVLCFIIFCSIVFAACIRCVSLCKWARSSGEEGGRKKRRKEVQQKQKEGRSVQRKAPPPLFGPFFVSKTATNVKLMHLHCLQGICF